MVCNEFLLPSELKGKGINSPKIIPTACSLRLMLKNLKSFDGNRSKLRPYEVQCYKHYCIEMLLPDILEATEDETVNIIREHLIKHSFYELGANPFDIYIVAYVAQNIGKGRKTFAEYCVNQGMAGTDNCAGAIYSTGKGDGIYLGILNEDGSVKDWEFMSRWLGY